MRNSIVVIFLLITQSLISQSKSEIGKHIEAANANQLVEHFNGSVELSILQSSGVYNVNQAQVLLNNFFTAYPPEKYFVNHQGGDSSKKFFEIGTLLTEKGKFRIYFLYDIVKDKVQIIELRIENTD